jgi:hypothetical protein
MNFEQATKQYLLDLKNQNVVIDAYIIGVNEDFESSTCIGRFLDPEGTVKEKQIIVHKDDDTLIWNFLETLNTPLSEQ